MGSATPAIDVGGGRSTLVDDLLACGYTDLSVLDLSESALAQARDVLARFRVPVLEGQVSRRAALERALIGGASVTEFEPGGAGGRPSGRSRCLNAR